jgi:toxin-antitoxin system PIN domain toxin
LSYSIDVNVLLYASDQASPFNAQAIRFLEKRDQDPELFCVAWSTLMGYLRISTHPGIFSSPLSPDEALSNLEALLNLPRVKVLTELDGFLEVYREVTGQFPVRGNLVPDAHLAVLLRQHDVRVIYTTDADFKKFDFLKVRNPFE